MIKITDIKLNTEQLAGVSDGSALALSITDGYEFVDGKRTDNQTHIKVEAVMLNNKYEKVTVKVAGIRHTLTPEIIAQSKGGTKVRFKNLSGKFYRTNSGEYALSCTADGVEVIA